MPQCSFSIAAVHGQRSIPIDGMAAVRTRLPFTFNQVRRKRPLADSRYASRFRAAASPFQTFMKNVLEGRDEVQVAVTGVLSGSQDLDRPYSGHVIGFGVTVTLYRVAGRTCFMEPGIEVGGALDDGYFGFDEELNASAAQ
jgi:hypothetical protein